MNSKIIVLQRWTQVLLVVLLASMHRESCVLGGSANYNFGAKSTQPWGISTNHHNLLRPIPRTQHHSEHSHKRPTILHSLDYNPPLHQQQQQMIMGLPRGGYSSSSTYHPSPSFVRVVGTITQLFISAGKTVLPTVVAIVKGIVKIYKALPMEAITAQIGLVYCFLGGYYPTLFSSLQAAKYCGWHIMVKAISELTEEAITVIDELEDSGVWDSGGYDNDGNYVHQNPRAAFLKQTHIVLTTVDPVKINTAAGALYTTWLGISTILRREYARVINLSLTLAEGMEGIGSVIVAPAMKLVMPQEYHRWVPVLLGWTAKAAAMRIAWRIERVLTAATSAIAGGAIVARSLTKLVQRRKKPPKRRRRKKQQEMVAANNTNIDENPIDAIVNDEKLSVQEQIVGFAVGGLGFYTQMETQYRQQFSFVVPFPFSLLTWPFDLAERWIQWYITEKAPP